MAPGYYLQAGFFKDREPLPYAPLEYDALQTILARFADEGREGEMFTVGSSGGWEAVLGYIDGTPVALLDCGVIEWKDTGNISPRVEAFVTALCKELDCAIRVCVYE
jgi:hypothetical protein